MGYCILVTGLYPIVECLTPYSIMDEKEFVKRKLALEEEKKQYLLDCNQKKTEITLGERRIIEIDWELTELRELYESCKE